MQALFEGGRVVDLIVALMVVEGLALAVLHRRTGRGIPALRLVPNLCAGACLMLALRASLSGAGAHVIGSWLALGLVGHLADLVLRWSNSTVRH